VSSAGRALAGARGRRCRHGDGERTQQQLIRAIVRRAFQMHSLEGEETRRRQASLRWGTILVALALGFAGIEAFGWTEASPGVFALLLGATGIGNLVAFVLARRVR